MFFVFLVTCIQPNNLSLPHLYKIISNIRFWFFLSHHPFAQKIVEDYSILLLLFQRSSCFHLKHYSILLLLFQRSSCFHLKHYSILLLLFQRSSCFTISLGEENITVSCFFFSSRDLPVLQYHWVKKTLQYPASSLPEIFLLYNITGWRKHYSILLLLFQRSSCFHLKHYSILLVLFQRSSCFHLKHYSILLLLFSSRDLPVLQYHSAKKTLQYPASSSLAEIFLFYNITGWRKHYSILLLLLFQRSSCFTISLGEENITVSCFFSSRDLPALQYYWVKKTLQYPASSLPEIFMFSLFKQLFLYPHLKRCYFIPFHLFLTNVTWNVNKYTYLIGTNFRGY